MTAAAVNVATMNLKRELRASIMLNAAQKACAIFANLPADRSSAEAIAQFGQADTVTAPPNPNFTQMISNRAWQCGQHSGSLIIMLIRSSKPL